MFVGSLVETKEGRGWIINNRTDAYDWEADNENITSELPENRSNSILVNSEQLYFYWWFIFWWIWLCKITILRMRNENKWKVLLESFNIIVIIVYPRSSEIITNCKISLWKSMTIKIRLTKGFLKLYFLSCQRFPVFALKTFV